MKTFIIFDSNILYQRMYEDYSKFTLHQTFNEVRGKIERHDVESQFEVLVPEITINELFQHQLESFEENIKNLRLAYSGCEQIYEIEFKINGNFNYRTFLETVKELYITQNGIKILATCSESRFNSIVNRALNKHAPFEGGTKGNSDKGFKDAVIWESILEFAMQNEGEFIFLTNDKRFKDQLSLEFKEETRKNINIFNKEELSNVDVYIQRYSSEQNVKIKYNKIHSNLTDILPQFLTYLENEIFETIELNGTKCEVMDLKLLHNIIDLNEVGDTLYKFKLKGTLNAEKRGFISAEISFQLDFVLTIVLSNYEIASIILDGIEAILMHVDETVNMKIQPFKYIPHEYGIEDGFDEVTSDEVSTIKGEVNKSSYNDGPLNKINFGSIQVEGFVDSLSAEVYADILSSSEYYNMAMLIELLDTFKENASVDWTEFKSGVARMKKAIRLILVRNGYAEQSLSDFVDKVIEQAQEDYRKFIDTQGINVVNS